VGSDAGPERQNGQPPFPGRPFRRSVMRLKFLNLVFQGKFLSFKVVQDKIIRMWAMFFIPDRLFQFFPLVAQ
jgi:hypothetical protein